MFIQKIVQKREKKKTIEFEKAGMLRCFHYDYGTMRDGQNSFTILQEGDHLKCIYQKSFLENGEEERKEIDLPMNIMQHLKRVIKEERIFLWNGFQKSNSVMMDGYCFSLKADFDQYHLEASGIVMTPQNYDAGHEKLALFLETLI